MIIVETSAIFAILYGEAKGAACDQAIASANKLLISAGTLAETRVVAARRGVAAVLEEFLDHVDLEVVPVDSAAAAAVGRAYARWGKGLHPAKLNFGDCFAYVLAKERNCPLLFIGDDFAKTDVAAALQ